MVKLIKNEKFDFWSDFERRVAVSVLKTFLHGKKLRYLHDIRNTHIDFGEKILKCSTKKPKNVKKAGYPVCTGSRHFAKDFFC